MVRRFFICAVCAIMAVIFAGTMAYAEKKPPESVTIKLEGAKMAPVAFSHPTHVDKAKLDCAVCHHKDAKEPAGCSTCHPAKEAKDKAPMGRDAFHKLCQTCHKDVAAKGKAAPTKCNECHKK